MKASRIIILLLLAIAIGLYLSCDYMRHRQQHQPHPTSNRQPPAPSGQQGQAGQALVSSQLPVASNIPHSRSGIPDVHRRSVVNSQFPSAIPHHRAGIQETFATLPLYFEPNQGQAPSQAKVLSRGPGGTLFFTPSRVVLRLRGREEQTQKAAKWGSGRKTDSGQRGRKGVRTGNWELGTELHMRFLGANPNPEIVGLDPLPGTSNYSGL